MIGLLDLNVSPNPRIAANILPGQMSIDVSTGMDSGFEGESVLYPLFALGRAYALVATADETFYSQHPLRNTWFGW